MTYLTSETLSTKLKKIWSRPHFKATKKLLKPSKKIKKFGPLLIESSKPSASGGSTTLFNLSTNPNPFPPNQSKPTPKTKTKRPVKETLKKEPKIKSVHTSHLSNQLHLASSQLPSCSTICCTVCHLNTWLDLKMFLLSQKIPVCFTWHEN